MSRCFPYPPPGYTLCRTSEEALIESIKFQKETEKAQRNKDRKREKKEKSKVKKDRAQNFQKSATAPDQIHGKLWADAKCETFNDGTKSDGEPLERSSLSEEHGQPVNVLVPSSTADSTANSNKRKRPSSPSDCSRGPGNIIRIRLPSKKQSVPEQQLCSTTGRGSVPSTSGRTDPSSASGGTIPVPSTSGRTTPAPSTSGRTTPVPSTSGRTMPVPSTSGRMAALSPFGQTMPLPCHHDRKFRGEDLSWASTVTGGVVQGPHGRPNGDHVISTSQHIGSVAAARTGISPVLNAATSKKQKAYLKYQNLIENWAPPPLSPLDSGDSDWLFQREPRENRAEKKLKCANGMLPCSSSSLVSWPRAQYLAEVGMYALPYTVPL